jgi:hypothetical protein
MTFIFINIFIRVGTYVNIPKDVFHLLYVELRFVWFDGWTKLRTAHDSVGYLNNMETRNKYRAAVVLKTNIE